MAFLRERPWIWFADEISNDFVIPCCSFCCRGCSFSVLKRHLIVLGAVYLAFLESGWRNAFQSGILFAQIQKLAGYSGNIVFQVWYEAYARVGVARLPLR